MSTPEADSTNNEPQALGFKGYLATHWPELSVITAGVVTVGAGLGWVFYKLRKQHPSLEKDLAEAERVVLSGHAHDSTILLVTATEINALTDGSLAQEAQLEAKKQTGDAAELFENIALTVERER